jgi:hypothetical protein
VDCVYDIICRITIGWLCLVERVIVSDAIDQKENQLDEHDEAALRVILRDDDYRYRC